MGSTLAAAALPLVAVFASWSPAVTLPLLVLAVGCFLVWRTEVLVGADGVLIRTRFGRRFVPWSDVASLHLRRHGVAVQTRSAGRLELHMGWPIGGGDLQQAAAPKAFMERATEALKAYRRGAHPSVEAMLARGKRTHADWIHDLRDLRGREGDFRNAPLLDDHLWGVVESASADASARAGAAVVLARSADAGARTRLRIAAEACTAPGLRVVLDRTAAGAGEAEVEAALGVLAEEEGVAAPRAARAAPPA